MTRFSLGVVLAGLAMLAGCARQATEGSLAPDLLSNVFRQANVPVETVRVDINLPTSLELVITNGLRAPTTTTQTLSAGFDFVGNPKGFYSVARAYHVPNNDDDPIRLMGAALIKPGQTQITVDVESTALHLVAYWDWVDWILLGLSSLEAVEPLVRQHPRYNELVKMIWDALHRSQSPYEDDRIVSLSGEIAGDLVAKRIIQLPNTISSLSQSSIGTPTLGFKDGRLEVTNNTSITWAAGWMDYYSEQHLSSRKEVVIPEADYAFRWLTGPSTKTLDISSSPDDRYLVCLVPSSVGIWAPTNGAFPLQDLLGTLKEIANKRGVLEAALTIAGFIPAVGTASGIIYADPDASAMITLVESYIDYLSKKIPYLNDKRDFHLWQIAFLNKQLDQIVLEIEEPSLRASKDAQWKKLADTKYFFDIVYLGRKKGINYITKSGKIDTRFSKQIGLFVLRHEKRSLEHQLILNHLVANEVKQRLGWLKKIDFFGKSLVLPSLVDAAVMAYDTWAYRDTYACYDVQVGTKVTRYSLGPNMRVFPTQISNGRKSENYVFSTKILHLTQRTANFSMSFNFGDGTTGNRNVSANRSPHQESISHAYSSSGAYGLTIQLDTGASKSSYVVPVYIEMPDQSNDYNLNICDVWRAASSGGYGITRDNWDISEIPDGATFDISFNTYSIPDRIYVEYPVGTQVLDTGWRGDNSYQSDPKYPGGISGPGLGQRNDIFRKLPGQNIFRMVVVGPDRNTAWDYSVRCRNSTSSQSLGTTEVSPDSESRRFFRNNPER